MRRAGLYRVVLSAVVFLLVKPFSFSQNGIITGKVKYGKEVLQAATVSLGNKTILTDHKGEFSFSVNPGSYRIIITHIGYKKIERNITVVAGTTIYLDLYLELKEQMGEEVVLGSRSLTLRSNLNTPVPVDAFSSTQLAQTGQTSLMQMLNFVAPSVRTSQQISFEPITLRGLDPDHTLILLNGTRYNNTAYINPGVPGGQLGRGSAGNDLNTIPFSGIERIEILRDGATSQYGSDAIAGVINVVLKKSTGKTSINLHMGQHYEDDGENITLGVYHGIALNKKGFLNFSADMRFRYPTFRGGEYTGTVYRNYSMNATPFDSIKTKSYDDSVVKARGFDRMEVSSSGTTKLTSYGFLMNGAYLLKNRTELFWTGALNNLSFNFVNGYTLPRSTTLVNLELFPDGLKSRVKPTVWNVSGIVGARGTIKKGINWEYSSAYGMNADRFKSENTNNASQQYNLGKNAPTSFYTGSQKYQQLTNTLHFTKNYSKPEHKLKTINLGWGAEWRLEYFTTKVGEEASWKDYDTPLYRKQGGSIFSQIVSPDDVVNKNRSVLCAYIDIEAEPNDRFLLNLSSRYEYYSDFGGNIAGKLAVRYKLFNKLTLRGSISNGFRAPSMQQRHYSLITYGSRRSGNGTVSGTMRGIFNNEHPVTKLFGVPSLEAEKSVNFSGGLTSTISRHIYLTIDAYWIQIKNRIVLSGAFDRLVNKEVDSLLNDPSLNDYSHIDQVSFFSNAINTRTYGIDVVIHGKWNIHKAQLIGTLAANFTKTSLFDGIKTASNLSGTEENKNTLFSPEQRTAMEDGPPPSKIILSLNYKIKKIGFLLRNTRFDETETTTVLINPADTLYESFSPKILTDVSIDYSPKKWITFTAGANNIFDIYPDRFKNYLNTGQGRTIYPLSSPFGFMGGYYYISMSFNF